MKAVASCEVAIHVVKNAMVMNGSMQSKIYVIIFGLAAEIERDFIATTWTISAPTPALLC